MVLSAGAVIYSSSIRCSFDAAPSSTGAVIYSSSIRCSFNVAPSSAGAVIYSSSIRCSLTAAPSSAGAVIYSSSIRCSFDAAPSSAGAAFDAALPPRDSMNNDTPNRCYLLVCVDEISLPQFQEHKLILISLRRMPLMWNRPISWSYQLEQ